MKTQSEGPKRKKKVAALRGKCMFITWPQCDKKHEDILARMKVLFDPLWCIVAHEFHEDGSDHLHCLCMLKKRAQVSFVALNDVTGKSGDYQLARAPNQVMKYVTKDGDYSSMGIDVEKHLEEVRNKVKTSKADKAAGIISAGGEFIDIWKEYPGFALMNKRRIDEVVDFMTIEKYKKMKLDWEAGLQVLISSPIYDLTFGRLIVDWLHRNIRQKRNFKQKQLMIFGKPNLGKTSLIMFLETYLKVYHMAHHEYDDGWKDNYYDLVVLDEFKGQKKILYLNMWLQGGPYSLKVRYRNIIKYDNVPTIILGNFDLQACYQNCDYTRLESLETRLEIVEIFEYLEIKE